MAEKLYRVVFNGELTGEFDDITTRKKFSRLFHIDEGRTNALFSGKETVLKSNISKEIAFKFMIALSEAGCESYLEEVQQETAEEVEQETTAEAPEKTPEEKPPGDKERRIHGERRVRQGREPRPGAIVPDRRVSIRRKKDMQKFEKSVKSVLVMRQRASFDC